MRARLILLSLLAWAAFAGASSAIPYIPPPRAVIEAPIDRALANVAAMEDLDAAQRERLLGRLNLLAYMRNDAPFTYLEEDGALHEAGAISCEEAANAQTGGRPAAPQGPKPNFPPGARCARFDFTLGPRPEFTGAPPPAPSAAALARLGAARAHYEEALRLDDSDLRARLGLAYVLDRLGLRSKARSQLRSLLRRGLPRLAQPMSEWEDHVVLTETAAHLAQLATSRRDRRDMEELRRRLQASRPMIYVTPIVVPLADAPFEALVDRGSPVPFDFAGTGDAQRAGWLTPDAAWLVWDPEARGMVRSGFDLIGARTWSVFWRDGFEALRALDDDRSGALEGAELGGLALWRDANGDGVSDPGEVTPVRAHGIVALAVRGAHTASDLLTAPGGVRLQSGAARPLYDWTPSLRASGAPQS